MTFLQILFSQSTVKDPAYWARAQGMALLVKFFHISLRTRVQSPVLRYKGRYGGVHLYSWEALGMQGVGAGADRYGFLASQPVRYWRVQGQYKILSQKRNMDSLEEWHL